MNWIQNYLYKLLSVFKNKQAWIYTGVLITGFGLGNLFNSYFIKSDPEVYSPKNISSSPDRTQQQRQEVLERGLESGYEKVKNFVSDDLRSKKLTQEKANLIIKKQEEMYNYKKSSFQNDNLDEARQKRSEWQTWARQNQVSMKYLLPLL